ncbi:vomeronasal type-1 receptor 4-like [Trichosurus vulpecula]|uniref:vomeronasal type-1 receptor 4-like n=1 Tax=Trichosurus vulpecula TaxID=9337 RepID=UPI00186B1150|nr:vomeronasal type-1 receptor 4-like [Trichosurus vulpecula]
MSPLGIMLAIVFCSQTVVGVVGNSFLVFLFTFMFFTAHKLRPIDTIFIQLAWANFLLLLIKGIPQTMAALGLKNFLDDVGCKLVFYLHRVARALSLNMTCLLSGFQAITISPNTSRWTRLKTRTPTYIIPCSFLSWIFHLIVNISIPMRAKGTKFSKNISNLLDYGYCYNSADSTIKVTLIAVVVSLPDIACVGVMVFASSYMILFLKKHHKRVQHIHTSRLYLRAPPEIRATQSILLLVNTFVSFSSLNSILVIYMSFKNPRPWMLHSSNFLAACFPIISPFVLISMDSQVLKYCCVLREALHFLPFLVSPVLSKEPSPS